MYDMYKSPDEITVSKVQEQEAAAPAYIEDTDSEPGYVLTPTGWLPDGYHIPCWGIVIII